jgi:REP element-mobilizing transposase RayT
MVRGYHVTFTTYGFWLPTDPRGSRSTRVGAPHLQRFGPATRVETRRSLANHPHDPVVRALAKSALKYPAVHLDGEQARAVARGFADVIREMSLPVHACAILPEHVHLVLPRHGQKVELTISRLKRAATLQMIQEGIHPLAQFHDETGSRPSAWGRAMGWVVYLNSNAAIQQRIAYVESNPTKAGLRPQRWWFVTPFEP